MFSCYDPGSKAAGVSLWEGHELCAAWLARGKDWHDTAAAAFRGVCERVPIELISVFVIEIPQVYTQRKQKGDPNDLITVALNAGAFATYANLAGENGEVDIVTYKPHEWKGQVPKDIAIKRFQKQLSADERSRVEKTARSLQHNVWDAVGLGQYFNTIKGRHEEKNLV